MIRFAAFARKSRHRALGDRERDKRNWVDAAAHYRRHLLVNDRDVPIWIQLGHSLKESGLQQQAIAAYREAHRLAPNDGDALISLAHSFKVAGDIDNAVTFFRLAATQAGSVEAAAELEGLGVEVRVRTKEERKAEFGTLSSVIGARAPGFKLLNASDITAEPDGTLVLTSNDPWMVFDFRKLGAGAAIGVLTVAIAALDSLPGPFDEQVPDEDECLSGQIYVDRGLGFNEQQSLRFEIVDGVATILLVDPGDVRQLRLDPSCTEGRVRFDQLAFTPIADVSVLKKLVTGTGGDDPRAATLLPLLVERFEAASAHGDDETGRHPRKRRAVPELVALREGAGIEFSHGITHDYDFWLHQNDTFNDADLARIRDLNESLPVRPKFSFVMPVYNTPPELLRECVESMLGQTYRDFEICIADDRSSDPRTVAVLEELALEDERIRLVQRKFNGHISAASNSALALATGDFVVLVDHDDLIPPYTLFVIASYLARNPDADVLYSDEDKVLLSGRRLHPYFKSDFNKYLMYGHNMISHLGVYRRSLVETVGGFRLGLEGSQDYDLFLRCYEQSSRDKIVHIPHVLYHWRILPGSTAMSPDQKSYAQVAAQTAINGHFERTGMPFRSIDGFAPGCSAIKPSRTFETPLSIIIPTRNGLDVLKPCVRSILARPHEHTEILIVDNGSDDPETLAYLDRLQNSGTARVLRYDEPFNFSLINNFGVEHATGEIVCFLNNDTEVLSHDWLNRARAFLSMDDVGAIGARLLFPDGVLQHFGIALGMGVHKVAGTPHGGMDGQIPGYFGKARLLQEVSAATAACLFMRKADFLSVNGFEPELRVAYNDVDLCLKIREKGLHILVDPDISLIHKESRSRGSDKIGERAKRLQHEADWMRDRWSHQLANDPYFSPNLDLESVDFAFSPTPRVAWPWAQPAGEAPAATVANAGASGGSRAKAVGDALAIG